MPQNFLECGREQVAVRARPKDCENTNTLSMACSKLQPYLDHCGVICPDHKHVLYGDAGCTQAFGRGDLEDSAVKGPYLNAKHERCLSTLAKATFQADPHNETITWTPSEPPCCESECDAERALQSSANSRRTKKRTRRRRTSSFERLTPGGSGV
jgi:hypothetical protein